VYAFITRNIVDCDQSNVLLARIIFFCILLTAFSSFLFTPQIMVPTASPRRQHPPCNWRYHVKWPQKIKLVTKLSLRRHIFIMVLSIVTMRLSSTVMEIWRLKDNAVTSLTFWGHVTSSVTWPFDSWGSTFYGWSIVTMRLSSTVMDIWPFKILPGTLFQEQRSVFGRSVGPQYYTDYTDTPLRYVRNVARKE